MNQQAMPQRSRAPTDRRAGDMIRAQMPRAAGWGMFAFVLSVAASLLHDAGGVHNEVARDGLLFWSFVVTSLTIEPVVSTSLIALMLIVLSRARLGGFAAILVTASVLSGLSAIFDRGAGIALFVPFVVYGHLFTETNEGRDDYTQGFVAALLAQLVFNAAAVAGLVLVRWNA